MTGVQTCALPICGGDLGAPGRARTGSFTGSGSTTGQNGPDPGGDTSSGGGGGGGSPQGGNNGASGGGGGSYSAWDGQSIVPAGGSESAGTNGGAGGSGGAGGGSGYITISY